ncbi:MAG: GWxTD domain-containing protein [Candidatus Fermentibacteraceae bacterium]|nr:GWxTD domain-containing protein [Candidatus Fermentibacteraceae bacterium]MBN2609595.1 GWxTD domain-containing protein [Candidatus Fermentibacteraceae bacterium]
MTLSALVLTVITGFQVTWNAEPARGPEGGDLHLTVQLFEEDLLFVMDSGGETACWELAAGVDGDFSVRRSGSVQRDALPFSEEIVITGIHPGGHRLTLMVTDRETGNSTVWEENIEMNLIDSLSWSSGNLQVIGGTYQRAAGSVEMMWNVYPPRNGGNSDDSLRAAYVMRNGSGVTEREGWMEMLNSEGSYRGVTVIDLGGLEAGGYEVLAAMVSDSEIVTAARADLVLLQAWDVWGDDPGLTETLVRPIAHSSELHQLSDAEGPSSRRAVMAEFWQKRDPTPGTQRNEYLEMYLSRLDEIDRRFSVFSIMGINTDQGRVFALLGEPDIIDSRPMEVSTLPTQVWTYCSPPIEVSFIDYDGCGMYELATDWEEVQAIHERHN